MTGLAVSSPAMTLNIEAAIIALGKAAGGQMAVLIVPSLYGTAIEDFGLAVMNQCGSDIGGKTTAPF